MINEIQLLSFVNSLYNQQCSCEKKSDVFNMVFLSLLEANKKQIQNQVQNIVSNEANLNNTLQNNVTNSIKVNESNNASSGSIDSEISIAAKKYGVDEKLIRSIIKIESNFNPKLVSSAGAVGLMQLMPMNFKHLGVSDPYDIRQNIQGGTKEIKSYLDKYNGDVEMALMAYNGGPTRMARRGVKSINDIYKMPKETQNYVPKVMKEYRS